MTNPTPPTAAELSVLLQQLAQHVGTLTTGVTNLSTQVANLAGTVTTIANSQGDKKVSVVEKPKTFAGKDSESARLFRHAFLVWAKNNSNTFALRDAQGNVVSTGGVPTLDSNKCISSALSYMTDDAAVWARPHIEKVSAGTPPFPDWDKFIEAFKAKFEPIDATTEAKNRIQSMRQGKRTFASLISEFETWSPRTGWTDMDLFDRLKGAMNSDYLQRLSYFPDVATDYAKLREYGLKIDLQLSDLHNNKANLAPTTSTTSTGRQTTAPFRDPNAMDIDASNFDSAFENAKSEDDIRRVHRSMMRGRCKVCASKSHQFSEERHPNVTCNHCQKKGHWAKVCLNRLLGKPAVQAAKATTDSAPAASASISATDDRGAEIAALRDALALQQKHMAELSEQLSKVF